MVKKINKAIFLDRDGVINKDIGTYVTSISMLELNTSKSIKILNY